MEKTNTCRKKIVIIAIVCALLAAAAITLGVLLGVYVGKSEDARVDAENSYRSDYFKLLDSLLDIETNLSKMKVASTQAMQTELMLNTAINAELAGQCLNSLSQGDYHLEATIKFCNQVQDFSKYIIKKIDYEEPITDEDYELLDNLHSVTLELGTKLGSMQENMQIDGYYFVEAIGEEDPFADIVDDVAEDAIKYPTLIYDGPFSDGLDDPTPHALKGEDVSQEQAAEKVSEYLSEYEVTGVEFVSVCTGYFDSYLFEFTTEEGKSGSAQISKKGGHLVMFDLYEEMIMPTYGTEEGVAVAERYCQTHGYDNMKAVWSTVSESELFVNLCYEYDGIIMYPDMIKIKVSLQTGKVIGFEALEYIYNHNREDEVDYSVTVTEEEVRALYDGKLDIRNVRLAVIPVGGGTEKLCYEVYGVFDDYKYFMYVDAEKGVELQVMQVIDSDDGELLM